MRATVLRGSILGHGTARARSTSSGGLRPPARAPRSHTPRFGRAIASANWMVTVALLLAGLLLGACGGGEQERRTPDWRARERASASLTQRWWWEPVERPCEENDDCENGETCQLMQLGTCPNCPRGEDAKICVGREGERNASAPPRR